MTSNREGGVSARSDESGSGLLSNGPGGQNVDSGSDDDESSMMGSGKRGVPAINGGGAVSIFYYAGLVTKSEIFSFKRLLFRASRGKILTKICEDAIVDYSIGY